MTHIALHEYEYVTQCYLIAHIELLKHYSLTAIIISNNVYALILFSCLYAAILIYD